MEFCCFSLVLNDRVIIIGTFNIAYYFTLDLYTFVFNMSKKIFNKYKILGNYLPKRCYLSGVYSSIIVSKAL